MNSFSRWEKVRMRAIASPVRTLRRDNGVMLVALVQSVIRTFNEHFSPFNERGGQKGAKRANHNLLEKSGMHVRLKPARPVPVRRRTGDYSHGRAGRSLDFTTKSPIGPCALSRDPAADLLPHGLGHMCSGFSSNTRPRYKASPWQTPPPSPPRNERAQRRPK